jgi:protein CpxP
MKRLVCLLILIAGILTGISAQENATPRPVNAEKKAANMTKILQKNLNLNEDQVLAVHDLLLARANEMDSLQKMSNGKGMGKQRKALIMEYDQKLNDLLNEDQKKAYAQWKEDRMERQKH